MTQEEGETGGRLWDGGLKWEHEIPMTLGERSMIRACSLRDGAGQGWLGVLGVLSRERGGGLETAARANTAIP